IIALVRLVVLAPARKLVPCEAHTLPVLTPPPRSQHALANDRTNTKAVKQVLSACFTVQRHRNRLNVCTFRDQEHHHPMCVPPERTLVRSYIVIRLSLFVYRISLNGANTR